MVLIIAVSSLILVLVVSRWQDIRNWTNDATIGLMEADGMSGSVDRSGKHRINSGGGGRPAERASEVGHKTSSRSSASSGSSNSGSRGSSNGRSASRPGGNDRSGGTSRRQAQGLKTGRADEDQQTGRISTDNERKKKRSGRSSNTAIGFGVIAAIVMLVLMVINRDALLSGR